MKYQVFKREINYYETDKMQVVHHSNYIRFMEEARVAYLEQLGFPYAELERRGVISPVTAGNCKYLATTTFDDRITVDVRVEASNGVVLTIGYDMPKHDGTRVFTGTSEHCFLNPEGHFIRLRRDQKEFYEMLMRELNVHHPTEGETSHE